MTESKRMGFNPGKVAIKSRILLLAGQLVISFLGPKYDTSSIQQSVISQNYKPTEFNSSRHNNGHENIPAAEMQTMDQLTIAMLSGFGNWDSVYFFHISLYGYQYEQMLAFFPFFPFLNSWIARVIKGCLFNTINMVSALYLAAIFITTTTFTVAATVLHKITSKITSDENFADLTVVMFCLNPANIFHLTAYTESTFICFQLAGICALEMMSNKSKFIISGLFFGLASATRSNGLISVGFLVCKLFQETLQELQINQSPDELIDLTFLENLLKRSLAFAMGILTAVSPFIMFQYFAYQIYCTENRPLDVFPNHWCFKTLPTSYSYIQSYYWNNGPFRYYEWKQIPNFMLAVPVIMMSYTAIWLCLAPLRVDWKTFCKSLVVKECKESSFSRILECPQVFPYACHLFFLVTFGVVNIHVQVLTRMLFSSSPLLFWFSAAILYPRNKKQVQLDWKGFLVLGYFILYSLLGLLLHCSFYPWT